jgi:hypothetical protein
MEIITTADGRAAEGLSGPGFTELVGTGINKKPAAGGTATGNMSEAKGTCSMSNHSTSANGGKVQFIKPCVGKTLNALGIKHNQEKRAFNCQHPDHNDKHASASYGEKTNTKNGTTLWKCHGCGRGGDAVDLVRIVNSTDYAGAMDFLQSAGLAAGNVATNNVNGAKPPKVHATLQKAVDALVYVQNKTGGKWAAAMITPYADVNGLIVAYVARLESEEGKKYFGQITPRDGGYVTKGPDSDVPPLGLPNLDKTKPLVIVEGEKAAYAAENLGLQATAWIGGAKATAKTDWAALKGFDCIIWPDNDEPGRIAAAEVAGRLAGIASRIRILPLGDDLKAKDDAADVLEKYGPDGGRRWFDSQLELADDHKADAVAVQSASRPTIVIPLDFNNPAVILEKITPHLAGAGVFRRESGLCRVIRADIGESCDGLTLSGAAADLHDSPSITIAAGQAVSLYREKFTKKGGVATVAITPPADLMKQLLRLGNWPGVPFLAGVTTAPIFRPDGSICGAPGYDRITGWFYDGEPVDVPLNPTDADATLASNKLLSLVSQFEWSAEHRAAWLGYLLTLLARPGIVGNVPGFVFSATTPGAGKSLLVNVANIIAYGVHPAGYQPAVGKDDEWRKAFFAFALAGSPSLVVSNYPSGEPVGNAVLDMCLTESRIVDRILGASETQASPWVATVAITGNNLQSSADFAFRSIWSILEPTTENPRERDVFSIRDLARYVADNRREYLGYALTILRWHAAKGFPSAGGKHFGSFERWAQVVRDPIMHLESVDICRNIETAEIADVQRDELTGLVCGLAQYHGWKVAGNKTIKSAGLDWFNIAELYGDLKNNPTSWDDLRQLVDADKSQSSFASSVGKLLRKHCGRIAVVRSREVNKKTGEVISPKIIGKFVLKRINRKVYVSISVKEIT